MKKKNKAMVWFTGLILGTTLLGCGKGTLKMTDTMLWMNGTHAIITAVNGGDYQTFGMMSVEEEASQQQRLKESWEVTDSASADETLAWLSAEGHHAAYEEEMEKLTEAGLAEVEEGDRAAFIYEKYEITEEEAQLYAELYIAYEKNGETAILAWDYSRAMALIEDCYRAGYYTQKEALDKSLEEAKVIQSTFDSWDAFVESYLTGYEYWSGSGSEERRKIYEELKAASDNPYRLKWGTALETSW